MLLSNDPIMSFMDFLMFWMWNRINFLWVNGESVRPRVPADRLVSIHNYTQYVQKMQHNNTLNPFDRTDHNKLCGFPENVQFQLTWFLDLMKLKFNDPCWEIGPLLQQKINKKI